MGSHIHTITYIQAERERESCIRDRPNYRMIKRNLNFALLEKHNVCKICVCVCVCRGGGLEETCLYFLLAGMIARE